MITLDEVMQIAEPLIRQRSTFVLFEMRRVLKAEATTPARARRARAFNDELRAREALPPGRGR